MMHETGIGFQNLLFFIGVVENNVDERLEGRVQVRAFGIHGTNEEIPSDDLPWATLIIGSHDTNFVVPPINSWVFGAFLDGRDAQQPIVFGIIPTVRMNPIDPSTNKWGNIPLDYSDRLAFRSGPNDIGKPILSDLQRGESLEDTNLLAQNTGRVMEVKMADSDETWSEPPSPYAAKYPFNRVVETSSGHTVELDDTPGAERIRIFHRSGSFLEVDSRGTKVDKTVADKYEINDRNMHVYVGGKSVVYVNGDSQLYVNGNMTEEIAGDCRRIVHGNFELSVGGQLNLNGSEEIQARAAKVTVESNVENISLKSAKAIKINGGTTVGIKAGAGMFMEAAGNVNVKGDAEIRIGSGGLLSLSAPNIAADDEIDLSSGLSVAAEAAGEAGEAVAVDLGEPATKAPNASGASSYPSYSTSGYASVDDGEATSASTNPIAEADVGTAVTRGALTQLLDAIAQAEGAGYNTVYGGSRIQPPRALTAMTVGEVLEWQKESVAAGSISSAAGRYQVIRATLEGSVAAGVVALSDTFNGETQDKIATYLLAQRGLNRFVANQISSEAFGNAIAREWASFPVITTQTRDGRTINPGDSYYSGVAGNKSRISVEQALSAINSVKNYQASGGNMV